MVIKWNNNPSDSVASNKPPTTPVSPDPSFFKHKVEMDDGRIVWVSVPVPDRLTFISYLKEDYFSKGIEGGGSGGLSTNAMALGEGIAGAQAVFGTSLGYFAGKPQKHIAHADLALGPRGSNVRVELLGQKFKDEPEWFFALRVECNPRKLTGAGFSALWLALEQAAPVHMNIPAMLAGAQLKRLDIAIDVLGMTPVEFLLRPKFRTKWVTYRGHDHHLETIQLHRSKKNPDTPGKKLSALGKLDLKVYDRNRMKAAFGKLPSYPGHNVTRLEVVKNRFTNKIGLADLPGMPAQFDHVKVLDRDSTGLGVSMPVWRGYVACRSHMDHASAAEGLGLDAIVAKQCRLRYEKFGLTLLPPEVWLSWSDGLALTGLAGVIEAISESH